MKQKNLSSNEPRLPFRTLQNGLIFLLILLVASCSMNPVYAQSQKKKGLDLIGLKGFTPQTVKMITEELPTDSSVGTLLDNTFGPKNDNIFTLCNSGKVSEMTIDLFNTTAVRNGKLQPVELLKGYTQKSLNTQACKQDPKLTAIIDKQIEVLKNVQERCPNTLIRPSLFLEHNLERTCAESIIGYARTRYTPKDNAPWVDSPMMTASWKLPY